MKDGKGKLINEHLGILTKPNNENYDGHWKEDMMNGKGKE